MANAQPRLRQIPGSSMDLSRPRNLPLVMPPAKPGSFYPRSGSIRTEISVRRLPLLTACLSLLLAPFASHACGGDPAHSMASLEAFVSGQWTGSGKFASGKDIAADVAFAPVPGGHWLNYTHVDHPPGRYRAQATWGYADPTHFVMTLHDNFGGARVFSSEGWCDGRIVFDKQLDLAQLKPEPKGAERERFVFERTEGNRLKMTYERGTEAGDWRMVDSLTFERRTPVTASNESGSH